MKSKKLSILSLLVLSSLAIPTLAGCGGGEKKPDPQETIAVTGITLSAPTQAVVLGKTLQLATTITPANATNQKVTYASSDESVATVSSTGEVSGLKIGRATITATTDDGSFTNNFKIVVTREGTKIVKSLDDLIDAFESSDYAANVTTVNAYGLNDSSNVGANPDADKQVLVNIPEDSEFKGNVFNVDDITLSDIKEYYASATAVTTNLKIRTAVKKAKAANDKGQQAKVKFSKDQTYVVDGNDLEAVSGSNHFVFALRELNGTYFDGNGSTIEIAMPETGPAGYFYFDRCQNVSFANFKLTQDVPTSLTGEVKNVDVELRKITLKVNKEFNEVVKRKMKHNDPIKGYLEFHEVTLAPLQGGNFFTPGAFGTATYSGNEQDGYEITIPFTTGIINTVPGRLATVFYSQYDAYGLRVCESKNTKIDNVTMHYASGMGLVGEDDTDLYVNRFKLIKKEGSSALVTSTADGMHFSMCHGVVKLTNNVIEYTGDDALNIKHGYYYDVTDKVGGSTHSITLGRITTAMPAPVPGDLIQIYEEADFTGHNPASGAYTVKSCDTKGSQYVVVTEERLSDPNSWGKCRATFLSNTPNLEFSNNVVRNKRNRGILVQVPNAVIKNNTFNHVGHGSMMIHSAMDVFNEATLPQNATIENNKIMNGNFLANGALTGDVSFFAITPSGQIGPKGTIHGMRFINNYVGSNGTAALSLRATGDSLTKNNLFYNIGVLENLTESVKGVVSLNNSGTAVIEDNYNYNLMSANLNGIVLRGLSGTKDVTVNNNFDLEFEKEEGDGGPEIHVDKSKNAITVDGSLDDWASTGAHDVEILGRSSAESIKVSEDELADHFKVNKLMLTYTDQGLYFGFDVFDTKIDVRNPNEFWFGDVFEVIATNVLDKPSADTQIYKNDPDAEAVQFAAAPGWSGDYTITDVRTSKNVLNALEKNSNGASAKIVKNANGYVGEAFMSFDILAGFKATIDAGEPIAMAIVIADAARSDLSLARMQYGNVPHFVENYKTKTAKMPLYYFGK